MGDGDGKKPRGGKKAARPRAAPATDATPNQQAARAALETPAALGDDNATAAQHVDDGHPVASVDKSRGAQEEDNHDDDDDEQVERFYALLASIRAMRGQLAPRNSGRGDNDTDTAGDSTTKKKRLRRSVEPPWRPVFRMEDFEEPPPPAASTCKRGHGVSSGGSASPPVAIAVVASSMPHAAVRFQQSDSSSQLQQRRD